MLLHASKSAAELAAAVHALERIVNWEQLYPGEGLRRLKHDLADYRQLLQQARELEAKERAFFDRLRKGTTFDETT